MKRVKKQFTLAQFQAWGTLGGLQRAANLTPARRRKIASNAAKAREARRRKDPK